MKKWTALFLAFVLVLSLPLIFATNEFDSHDHEADHECGLCGAGGNSPMGEWGYCPVCDLEATLDVHNVDFYENYSDAEHRVITYEETYCTECGYGFGDYTYVGDAWEGHTFDIPHGYYGGIPVSACICGAEYYGK